MFAQAAGFQSACGCLLGSSPSDINTVKVPQKTRVIDELPMPVDKQSLV